ncbi:hypothetical protein SAMN04490357_7662 [Streptomyces misionensis]|uniref:Uncharacterized protein n=1 Tax=Streptomyces misionensis TaxID=67331 RepID=A0A1H5K1Q9_9ACTN|nr:hypothetical protein [Streptomyces misionensis]SEE58723.1 hypothetical protein SAMN04490357_7662 [Streptomyces misionensis]
MTAAPDHLALPARRRRHARLISTLTTLIGGCADAAGDVYGPIAAAPPEQSGVPVSLEKSLQLSLSAPLLLDQAVQQDAARWPSAVLHEQATARRTFAARCALASAEQALHGTEQDQRSTPGTVPPPTVPQSAALDLAELGEAVLTHWAADREEAVALVERAVAGGEYTAHEILDEATDVAVLAGVLALHDMRGQTDPSAAAECCLLAARHYALAISLASADLDDIR